MDTEAEIMALRLDIEPLLGSETIKKRVEELAHEITTDFGKGEFVLIGVLNGSFIFLADLMRALYVVGARCIVDFVAIESYGLDVVPGEIEVLKEPRLILGGKRVLIVEDILDRGNTIANVREMLLKHGPKEIRTCVLLSKDCERDVFVDVHYVGFKIKEDDHVVGYGLDYSLRFRQLPYIGVIHGL